MFSALLLLLFATSVLCRVANPLTPLYQAVVVSKGFELEVVSSRHDGDLQFDGWVVSYYHLTTARGFLTLKPRRGFSPTLFYVNGTTHEALQRTSNLVEDHGSPPYPRGVQILAAKGSNARPLQITSNTGSSGLHLSTASGSLAQLMYGPSDRQGSFFACNDSIMLNTSPQMFLFYRDWDTVTPAGCIDVTLQARWYTIHLSSLFVIPLIMNAATVMAQGAQNSLDQALVGAPLIRLPFSEGPIIRHGNF